MNIYDYEGAFGAWDVTSEPMRRAIERWYGMYYADKETEQTDPCQKIAYTVVNKLVRTMFGEYRSEAKDRRIKELLSGLAGLRKRAMQQTLVGGECYLKPCPERGGFSFTLIPRTNLLIFGRDSQGNPTDVGTLERAVSEKHYFTLLERRRLESDGRLILENRLFRSLRGDHLGNQVPLKTLPQYAALAEQYRYERPMGGIGLVRLQTPMLNCIDGSPDGVAVFAAAEGLIRNIDRNEAQMNGEFSRGESRILASSDLMRDGSLQDHLFTGLDEDPEQVGITIFSPQLREQSFLARKREYLRNVESMLGLKRGMLSDANAEDWTATEISSSAADYNLTIIDFQEVWQRAVEETVRLCEKLSEIYGLPLPESLEYRLEWGNGILYDEDKTWEDYKEMTRMGLIMPEKALGWRFGLPAETEEEKLKIRREFMPVFRETKA